MLSFGKSSQDRIIGVAITPHVGVEVAIIDRKTGAVHKYTQRPLSYNSQKREIEDYAAFKGALIDMCGEIGIDIRSKFYLVLPNILFNFIDLPANISGEEIESIITAKVEESYLFRKVEPMVSYCVARSNPTNETNYLAYSAIQKDIVDKFKDVFSEMGGELIGVETSNTASIRAIEFQKIANESIKNNDNWNVLLVSSNNYMLFALTGNSLIDCTEVPIAIKSLSIEEAYQAVATSVSQNLPNYPAKKLIIISQTDDISAEALKSQIGFDNEIEALECNKYAKSTRLLTVGDIQDSDIMGMSLSAIGAGACQVSKLTSTLNFLSKKPIASSGMPANIGDIIILAASGVLLVVMLLLYFGLMSANNYFGAQAAAKEAEIQTIQNEVNALKGGDGTVRIEDLIPKISANNKKAISYYDSLSTEIPKHVWLTYVYLKDGENVAIEGLSLGINDIYEYYKGLKNSTPSSTIQLKRLKIITDMVSKEYNPNEANELKLYDFEISNTTSKKAARNAPAPAPGDGQPSSQDNGGNPGDLNTPPPPPSGAPQLAPVNVGDNN